MIERFRMLSVRPQPSTGFAPLRLADFDHFNQAMNEAYLDLVTSDRMGNEILIESTIMGVDDNTFAIINEGVVGAVWDSARKLFGTIINFIKGLIAKINLFADSMNKNIGNWMKKVAPKALANSKNLKLVGELSYEGYNWNENYITTELMHKMEESSAFKVKVKTFKASNRKIISAETTITSDIPSITKFIIDSDQITQIIKDLSKEDDKPEEKQPKVEDKPKDGKTFDAKVPEGVDKPDDEAKKPEGAELGDVKGGSNKEKFKEVLDEFFKSSFNATKSDYVEKITLAARRSKEPVTKKNFSAGIIKRYVDFVGNSPAVIGHIQDRYERILEEYNKFYDALNNLDYDFSNDSSSDVASKYNTYVKQPIYEMLGFTKDLTAINNTISRLNISLIEECAKEYIKACNKLALMKGA